MASQTEPNIVADKTVIEGLDHWRTLPIKQQPEWPDAAAVKATSAQLAALPPLVFAGEVDSLRERLAKAAQGQAFLLQGGDCAETFAGATADKIRNRIKTVLQMAVVLTYAAEMPVIKMGRMAGQFAKPRSSDTETRGEITLPAYRGDIVNGYDFTPESRTANPDRLLQAYNTSVATLNLIRAFTTGGFADLREVHRWNQGFAKNPANVEYEAMANEIDRAIKFMAACGADFDALKTTEFFVSHEALLMDYERPMTRIDSRTGTPYNTSAHFLWIGERTRELDGAHVDFLSRVRNPIGVKLGPTTDVDTMKKLIDKLDPEREPGRLTFITRMGAGKIFDEVIARSAVEGVPLANPAGVLFSLADQYVGTWMSQVMSILVISSLFAGLLAFQNATSRYFFAMGRGGVLPKRFGTTNKAGAPMMGVVLTSALAAAVIVY
ncbi:MAG: hypothetical protein RLY59_49, partial [Actinomycetota bacterium]